MLAPDVADRWLYATLTAVPLIAAAGVHNTIASQPTSRYVVFQQQSGTRRRGVGNATLWHDLIYLVKVVEQATSYSGSAALREAIHDTLQGKQMTTPDGTIVACVSETEVRYVEVENGIQYRHAGETWRMYVQGTG